MWRRALKTKHETPKYGLIYHASLIGQAPPKYKGKISRVLAAKCSLATRVDALGDSMDASVGLEARQKVKPGRGPRGGAGGLFQCVLFIGYIAFQGVCRGLLQCVLLMLGFVALHYVG